MSETEENPPTVTKAQLAAAKAEVAKQDKEEAAEKAAADKMAKQAEKEAKAAEKAAKKAEADQAKAEKEAAEKAAKEAAAIELPIYFTSDYNEDDPDQKLIDLLEAKNWLTGVNHKQGRSFSAKITYKGGRRFMSQQVVLGKRSLNPNQGNWKLFVGSARFRRSEEFAGLIKDVHFLHAMCTSQGGQENFDLRWLEDVPLDVQQEKKTFLRGDKGRILGLPFRIRKSQVYQGLKIPLRPGEANKILELAKKEDVKLKKPTVEYLHEIIQEEHEAAQERKKKSET